MEEMNYRKKQKQNPMPRKVKSFAQGHTANWQQSDFSNFAMHIPSVLL